ncbi:unnamed protein product [Amoebophrya sp. A25]|nr:unnamed protein product [Amoebophrya sp. A25]|eukprot:GSA25T00011032001.1
MVKTANGSHHEGEPAAKRRAIAPTANEKACVDVVRCLAADVVQKANSGHPGAPMGCAPLACALFSRIMNISPKDPNWINRDRFVLSNGHACALQYIMLHLSGYGVSMDDLKQFRQLHSKTPGHPENFCTPGVEVCTGPLGQGITNAVGMALAESHLAARFNKPGFPLFDHYTYVLTGDGCMMEGVASEACSLAGHLKLNKLIVFYDDNKISIDGSTDLAFTEDVGKRFDSYGWNVIRLETGDLEDLSQFEAATRMAKSSAKPTFVMMRTTIGFGCDKAGSEKTHGAPLGADSIKALKSKFGFDPEKHFQVPQAVRDMFEGHAAAGNAKCHAWNAMLKQYVGQFPELGGELQRRISGKLPPNWKDALPKYDANSKAAATRVYGGECLKAMVNLLPEMVGGCADLAPSCNTKHVDDYQASNPLGRYIRFGVREHAMAGICNGMMAYSAPYDTGSSLILPYCATFAVFIGYAWGSARLSALSKFPVLYIGTHDSIDLGEDGPTHQPIEMMQLLRSTPNFLTIRPADGNETSGAYCVYLENKTRPSAIILSRSTAPHVAGSSRDKVAKGAYVITEDANFDIVLSASGQEVDACVKAKKILNDAGHRVRVVSFPCWELFAEQSTAYQESVIPAPKKGLTRVYVESCSTSFGLCKYADLAICMESFGASAPGGKLKEEFGFTPEKIAQKVLKTAAMRK